MATVAVDRCDVDHQLRFGLVTAPGNHRRAVRRTGHSRQRRRGDCARRVDEDASRRVTSSVGGVVDAVTVGSEPRWRRDSSWSGCRRGSAWSTWRSEPTPSPVERSACPIGLDRADLREVLDRHRSAYDDQRPDAVDRRRARGRRTARENIDDARSTRDTFVEYGPLVIAAQRRRRSVDDLIASTPADGLVGGIGDVNGRALHATVRRAAKCVAVSYDYTVLAGTQGSQNHRKKDRSLRGGRATPVPDRVLHRGGRRSPWATPTASA